MAKKVLIITAENFEDSELLQPLEALVEKGADVDIAAPEKGTVQGKKGDSAEADLSIDSLPPKPWKNYDLLLLPGGKAPAQLREIERVLEIVKGFNASEKPIGAICHGPQILISAGIIGGRAATSYSEVQQELVEAGAVVQDTSLVTDKNLFTSRNPDDLPDFIGEMLKRLDL